MVAEMDKKYFQNMAEDITQEYIESYGMELNEIDKIDKMIANKLEEIYKKGWSDGYGECFDDESDYDG